MREVGAETLPEQLNRVLGVVQAGETVLVTSRGQPIARIEPVDPSAPPEVRRRLATGRAHWGGQPVEPCEAAAIAPGPALSDIVLAQRSRPGKPDHPRRPGDAVSGE